MDTVLSKALREFTTGPLNQLIVNLGGQQGPLWEEEFKRFLRQEICWADQNMQKLLAERKELKRKIAELTGEPKPLYDHDFFFRARSGLYVSDSFRNLVVAKTFPSAESRAILTKTQKLSCNMTDEKIEKMLGNGHIFNETALCDTLAEMLQKQWGGKGGRLLNNGYANLFYTTSCVVSVHWYAGGAGWSVDTWERGDYEWDAGDQVFSPATVA